MDDPTLNTTETPKTARPRNLVTSTVDKTKSQQKRQYTQDFDGLESSLGLLSLSNVDLSNIMTMDGEHKSINEALRQHKQLINNTLERASKVAAIPSKYFHKNLDESESEGNVVNRPMESTISDSDLIQTVKSCSTPRTSTTDMQGGRPSSKRESIFMKFKDMLESNISIDNAVEEFKQLAQANQSNASIDSALFVPGEGAEDKLLADEQSWKNKYGIPAPVDINSFQNSKRFSTNMSMSKFFLQGSDSISNLGRKSNANTEPFALIESSGEISSNNISTTSEPITHVKSLSISAIQQLISAEDSPNKVLNYICSQKKHAHNNQKESLGTDILSVPVSRDTSYTTSFSDNGALQAIISENKENIKPYSDNKSAQETVSLHSEKGLSTKEFRSPQSPPSRSTSSLSSLPNGKLPIESTAGELVWGCVKVDRCVTKQFVLRNRSPNTLRIQCSLSTYEYKIRKDIRLDSEPLSACKIVLRGHESRPLIISFTPTKMGAAVDELCFTPLDAHLTQTKKQSVRLWGYGGYCNIEYRNGVRDNTGKYWLSLGRLDNRVIMEQTLRVKNTGNLPSFTYAKVQPKQTGAFSNIKLEPHILALMPNEEKVFKITYTPNTKDSRILKQNLSVVPVTDIGKIELISGPEVARSRLRRLCRKTIERGLTLEELPRVLKEKIPGEIFPSDVAKFKENYNSISEILDTLNSDKVSLTIEQDPNETLVADYPEDSVIFQSLCQDTLIANASVLPQSLCRLEPPTLMLLPPTKTEDFLFLISQSTAKLQFEVNSAPSGLQVRPITGTLSPGETIRFKVELGRRTAASSFKISVYVDNEVFETEVKVIAVETKKNRLS